MVLTLSELLCFRLCSARGTGLGHQGHIWAKFGVQPEYFLNCAQRKVLQLAK